MAQRLKHKWGMVIDIDKCIGCQACVVACQAENNIQLNTEDRFHQRRAMEWIRVERYWEVPKEHRKDPEKVPFHDVKARFIPILCQHCENAPCEPVCPVFATYHNEQGLNVQVYNRCVGTRYCANNCPYQVRFFNFWEPVWPERMRNQLNPDVTVRSRGIMEKCTFCVQRLRRAERTFEKAENGEVRPRLTEDDLVQSNLMPACVQACPTDALIFGDFRDETSQLRDYVDLDESDQNNPKVSLKDQRAYRLLEAMGTEPNVIYLKKVDPHYEEEDTAHG